MEKSKRTGRDVTRWNRRGHVYAPTGELWWAREYATFPTVELLHGSVVRVYFTSLDDHRYGRIGYVELDVNAPHEILYETKEPILTLGGIGEFDDSGVNLFSLVKQNDRTYLYYQGWQRCQRVPYMLFTGLAIANNDEREFRKWSRVPVLDRTAREPFIRAAPYVLLEDDVFKMWYASGTQWITDKSGLHYNVVIRYATSLDGFSWNANEHICVEPNLPDEYAVGRPCVIRDGSLYRMWYSCRSFSKRYVIGYAESADGVHWSRKDAEAGIAKSDTGWDSEMICYPYVVKINGQLHMCYNGNRHGATGFGWAVLES